MTVFNSVNNKINNKSSNDWFHTVRTPIRDWISHPRHENEDGSQRIYLKTDSV